jgi:hypothetical protein
MAAGTCGGPGGKTRDRLIFVPGAQRSIEYVPKNSAYAVKLPKF